MVIWTYQRHEVVVGSDPIPTPDNDNWGVASNGHTPAEAPQVIRRRKSRGKREVAADFSLHACPGRRKTWEFTIAMEKCALWIYHRIRKEG